MFANLKDIIANANRQSAEHDAIHNQIGDHVIVEIRKLNPDNNEMLDELLHEVFIRISNALVKAKINYSSKTTPKVLRIVASSIDMHIKLHTELAKKHELENMQAAFTDDGKVAKH